ncbi:hypothetical protein J6590_039332 [Homalodisca vitripennis]|nr:hypothetical protein J6590_039332 [Homalodisca vitripennis]
MRMPLHLNRTTFCSLGVSDIETIRGNRFQRFCLRHTYVWIPSDEHNSRFQEKGEVCDSIRFQMLHRITRDSGRRAVTFITDRTHNGQRAKNGRKADGIILRGHPLLQSQNSNHRTTTCNRSFTVTACRLWHSLPDHVKQIESRERFVAELRRRYLDRMIVAGGGATL